MPTYEYECQDCGHRLEKFQPITAPELTECPNCRGRLTRLVGTGSCLMVRKSGPGGKTAARSTSGDECSFSATGRTCCGRDEPCHD
jgi:putative FmdB family regulatory protein